MLIYTLPVLLGRFLPSQAVFLVDLEIIVGAVEVRPAEVPFPVFRNGLVQAFDVFLIVASHVGDGIQDLVVGELWASVKIRNDPLEGLELASRPDDLGIGHDAEEFRHFERGLPFSGHDVDVPVHAEPVEHGLGKEVACMGRQRDLSDLRGRQKSLVHLLDLFFVMGYGIRDSAFDKIADIAESLSA